MDHNYANAYMKTATASLQEHVTLLLHAKTQNIVSGEIIVSLQNQIDQLNGKINELISELTRRDDIVNDRNSIQAENDTLRNKAATLDTALSQISAMKKTIQNKDQEIKELSDKIKFMENIQTTKPRRKSKITKIQEELDNNF